jgi:DNA-binding LacI/PurR family transcriptional regulator
MAITLKDIADQTGVSQSVVSTVLSGRDNGTFVSQETRERVQRVANALNYAPVRAGRPRGSRRLRQQRVERFVGVWAPEIDSSVASQLQALQTGLSRYAADHSGTTLEDYDYGLRLVPQEDLHRLDMLGVMGLVIVGEADLPREAAVATMPVVLMGEVDEPLRSMAMVHLDNFAAGRVLAEHLWSLGHRGIGFLAPSARPRARVTRQRWQGIQSAWFDHGAPGGRCVPAPFDMNPAEPLREQIRRALERLMRNPGGQVTAIVCFNEPVAALAIQALSAQGKRVPDDVSVATVGDEPGGSETTSPALTCIRVPHAQLGTAAISQLYALRRQMEPDTDAAVHQDNAYPGELVVRQSTAAPATPSL